MQIEYEATFINIDKDEIRGRLQKAGAKLVYPEMVQKRLVFSPAVGFQKYGKFLRVRDEGDKITITLKQVGSGGIEDKKEIEVDVSDFNKTISILEAIGCIPRSYEGSKRELWELDGAKITIDDWPFLYPLVEVECVSEQEVRDISERLGFDWSKAKFCTAGDLYREKYGKGPLDIFNEKGEMTTLVFDGVNPFV